MDEPEQQPAPLPVLSYANPLGAPPANGRVQVEQTPEGPMLTDPRSAATSSVLVFWCGVLLCIFGSAATVGLLYMIVVRSESYLGGHLTAAIIAVGCGIVCMSQSKTMKQEPRRLWIKDGWLFTSGIPEHGWTAKKLRPRRFSVSIGSIDLLTHQTIHSLRVHYPVGYRCHLLPALSRDEALWLSQILNRALQESPTPVSAVSAVSAPSDPLG